MMFGEPAITAAAIEAASMAAGVDRDRLIDAIEPQIRAMVITRLSPTPGQWHLVDDLAQQSLMAIVGGLASLRKPTVTSFRAFMSTVVSRRVAEFLKQKAAHPPQDVASLEYSICAGSRADMLRNLISAGGISPRSDAARREQFQQVLSQMSTLRERHREVITFAFIDQLSSSEIAERLELSRPATSMLLFRALRTLRRNITGSSRLQEDHDLEPR